MLFVLSIDLLPFCRGNSGKELEGLQNLLLCARRGQHAITGPHEIFATLAKNLSLSQRERAMALNLANRRTELPLLERQTHYKVLVTASTEGPRLKRVDNFRWQVSICKLTEKFLTPIIILAENITDAELYQQAGRHYQISNRLNSVRISSSPRGGGGSQIDIELRSLLENGCPVFSITDGDATYPTAQPSVISIRCNTLISEGHGIGWHFSLPVREIENIIPLNVLVTVADSKNGPKASASIESIKALKDKLGACPSDFICFKKGQTLGQAFAIEKKAERDYWIGVATLIRHQRPGPFGACLDQESCLASPCSCYISNGFGESVLAQVKRWLLERSAHDALKSFNSNNIWMEIGSIVFDTGIAFKPETI